MKKNIILFLLTTLMLSATSFAQSNIKIGYADPNYILSQLPETKQLNSELEAFEKQLQTQLQSKYEEFQQKYQAYEKGKGTMAPLIREDKEKELAQLQQGIKEFEEKAQEEMQKKELSLLDPVIQKIQKAIDQVAEENGYTYIFSSQSSMSGSSVILYARNKTDNISELVLKKLGVTPAPANSTGQGTTPSGTGTTAKPGTTIMKK